MSSALSASSTTAFHAFSSGNATGDSVFGLYQCRGDLAITDCSRCIASAVNQIVLLCPNSYGAAIQLDGCNMRYEHGDFLGQLDTNLVYKKCSGRTHDGGMSSHIDDVLADLAAGGEAGAFSVSHSDLVHGFAQCSGDLSVADCSTCVRESIEKLRSVCGSTSAAEVCLVKCRVVYWSTGYYEDLYPDSLRSNKDDDVGRTVAIIVGCLGGIAILLVFLAMCSRATAK